MSDRLLGPTAPGSTREPGTLQLLLLLAGSCMPILGAVLIAPVLPQITAAFSTVAGVEVLVPIVLTVPALLVGLAAPFAGLLADAVDRKRVLIAAMVAYSVVGTAPLHLDTIQAILVSRVLVGVCEAAIMTCCTTLIGDYWSGDRRRRYLGLQTLVTALSATVFLGLGGALGAAGWRTPFWLYLAAAVIAVPMIHAIWQPERAERATRPLEPVPWRGLVVPCLVTLFGGIVFYALIVELSFVLDGAGVTSAAVIGAISALMSVTTAVGAGSFARVAKHGTRSLLAVGFGLAAIGLVTGLWTGSFFIGQFLSPLVIVGVSAGVGGLRPALGLLGLASLIAVPAILIGLRRTTQEVSP